MKTTIGERIKELRKALKLNQTDFGKRIGYKQSVVGQWENNQSTITDSATLLVCKEYNVSEEWLRTGRGEMFDKTLRNVIDDLVDMYHLSDFDKLLITTYAKLSPEQRKAVEDFATQLAENQSELAKQMEDNTLAFPSMIEIPKVGDTAAGTPMEMIENLYSGEMITVPEQYRGCIALTVKGDSMEPKIPYGSLVYVRQQKVLDDGDIGIFYINNEITCKKYKIVNGVPELHSINPNYPPIKFEENDEALIMGRVVDWQIEE